ncbi:hypothetical protein TcWFU_008806 [Taenia crassiceps]|uniref:Uncharacterized protein n=1 Tax=Taenia crassiceps TaxID=6207 RepID=A0ABR4Q2I6_9CEST
MKHQELLTSLRHSTPNGPSNAPPLPPLACLRHAVGLTDHSLPSYCHFSSPLCFCAALIHFCERLTHGEDASDPGECLCFFCKYGTTASALFTVNRMSSHAAMASCETGWVPPSRKWNDRLQPCGSTAASSMSVDGVSRTSACVSEATNTATNGRPTDLLGNTLGDDRIAAHAKLPRLMLAHLRSADAIPTFSLLSSLLVLLRSTVKLSVARGESNPYASVFLIAYISLTRSLTHSSCSPLSPPSDEQEADALSRRLLDEVALQAVTR